ncbi:hypothetical protein Psal073_03530 (plasmid) [Piscirickettsia salmonis]|uniref:hypothetical protein n=1 Tax=Piscirickettsia salmonis TaxID=1238 RepID=UPI0012B7FE73|nr:hypothetical protein [Piscirickettsia salmonis]QGO66881.1 hypothetical protein Psal073_01843 [Piscirickettsia salmonis]QGO68526.1 hypothetical protein Psal073_03530 [Piscirickettsia salmonis]
MPKPGDSDNNPLGQQPEEFEMVDGQPVPIPASGAQAGDDGSELEDLPAQDQAEAAAEKEREEREKEEKKKRLTEMRDALGKTHEDMGKQPERARSISKQHRDAGNDLTQRMEKLSEIDPKNVTDEEKADFLRELRALGEEANRLAMSDKEKVPLRAGFLGTFISLIQKFVAWNREENVDFQLEAIKDQAEALKQKFDSELSEYNTAGADGPKPGGTGPRCADDEEDADNQRDEEKKKKQKEEMMKELAM